MLKKLLFSSVFLVSACVYQEAHAFYLSNQKDLQQSVEPGSTVTASIRIVNESLEPKVFEGSLDLTSGLKSCFEIEKNFTLQPDESITQLLLIQVAPDCLAGDQNVRYTLRDLNSNEILETSSQTLSVAGVDKIRVEVQKMPSHVFGGDSCELSCTVFNEGNTPLDLELDFADISGFVSFKQNVQFFSLEPKTSSHCVVRIKADPTLRQNTEDSFYLKIKNARSKETLFNKLCSLKIFSKIVSKENLYQILPAELSFFTGHTKKKWSVFSELAAGGFINEDKKQFLDFLVEYPLVNQIDPLVRSVGLFPNRFFIHYKDPRLSVYSGDGLFYISALTTPSTYGRGTSISVRSNKLKVGALFVKHSGCKEDRFSELGTYLSYRFVPQFKVTGSCVKKLSRKHFQGKISPKKDRYISSIGVQYAHSSSSRWSAEYAYSGNDEKLKSKHQAAFIGGQGQIKEVSYTATARCRGEHFGNHQIPRFDYSTYVGFPFYSKARGFISLNGTGRDFEKKERHSQNQMSFAALGASWSMNEGYFGLISLDRSVCKSKKMLDGHERDFIHFNLSKASPRWTLQGSFDLGRSRHYKQTSHFHAWQQAQLYGSYSTSSNAQFALFTRFAINSKKDWDVVQAYGLSISKHVKRASFRAVYEFVDALRFKGKHVGSLHAFYTAQNNHRFSLRAETNYCSKSDTSYSFLLGYTIPLGLPIGKNKKVGSAKGKISHQSNEGPIPLANLMLRCNGYETITNNEGEFFFPDLNPGAHELWVGDPASTDIVLNESNPLSVEVIGGRLSRRDVALISASSLSGDVSVFALDTEKKELDSGMRSSEEAFFAKNNLSVEGDATAHEYKKIGGLANLVVTIWSEDGKTVLQDVTNAEGFFKFNKLRAGRWIVRLQKSGMPEETYIEENEINVEVLPGEQRNISFRVLPKIRKIYFDKE